MLIDIVIFFLGLSMAFYVLFGGADFGAGVLELISGEQDRETIADAIGPVWEANHVWLILVVVILFMGFPEIYSTMSLYLHIPLLLMLVGIVLRGTAFTYMHYDAIKDRSNHVYNFIFKVSSVLTPLFLGVIVGAMVLGKIDPNAGSFYAAFIAPWLNVFSFSVGLFCVTLFTFLAAVYLIGETKKKQQTVAFITAAKRINVSAVFIGALVFTSAHWNGLPLLDMFYQSWVAVGAVIGATVILPLLWRSLHHSWITLSRMLAGAQIILILFAWFWVQYPVAINIGHGAQSLTFYNAVAPPATMLQLVIALVIGSCIILPFLYFLMKTFKGKQFADS
jgi:cytochrome d ubiquinol oxidase subunit II